LCGSRWQEISRGRKIYRERKKRKPSAKQGKTFTLKKKEEKTRWWSRLAEPKRRYGGRGGEK